VYGSVNIWIILSMKTTIAVLLTGSMLLSTSVAAAGSSGHKTLGFDRYGQPIEIEVSAEAGGEDCNRNEPGCFESMFVDSYGNTISDDEAGVERPSVMGINQLKELRNRKVDEDGR